VLGVDRERHSMVVSHRDIPGYMRAMAMTFPVPEEQALEQLAPGSHIEFELVVKGQQSLARGIQVRPEAFTAGVPLPEPAQRVTQGAAMPDFELKDQLGRNVKLSSFRSKVIAVDFIYTRCPLPEICPRLSANFARLQRRFPEGLVLLSITIDPQYDTPEVLSRYARIWKADPERWRFLTGDLQAVREVAGRFGMVYWPEDGLMTHTSRTGVISKDGTLAAIVEGPSYQFGQLSDLIAAQLEAHP